MRQYTEANQICVNFLGFESWTVQIGSYYCVKFEMEPDNRVKLYAGRVQNTAYQNAELNCLRRKSKNDDIFQFPRNRDVCKFNFSYLISKLKIKTGNVVQ